MVVLKHFSSAAKRNSFDEVSEELRIIIVLSKDMNIGVIEFIVHFEGNSC